MQTLVSAYPKSELKTRIDECILSLHNIGEGTKEQYTSRLDSLAEYLMSIGIDRFEDTARKNIDYFLSTKQNESTRNPYIFVFKSFFISLGLKNGNDKENV